jgi:hypothetical protein
MKVSPRVYLSVVGTARAMDAETARGKYEEEKEEK